MIDYAYCGSEDCLHRRACKRWDGNYNETVSSPFWIKPLDCINSKPWGYKHLDRFRYSDGRPFETDSLKGFKNE